MSDLSLLSLGAGGAEHRATAARGTGVGVSTVTPCSRKACDVVYSVSLPDPWTQFVLVKVGMDRAYRYCSPRCASMDLTERFAPGVL